MSVHMLNITHEVELTALSKMVLPAIQVLIAVVHALLGVGENACYTV